MSASPRPRGLLRRFFRECVRPHLVLQIEIALCMALGVALELADPLILKVILDRALGDGDAQLLVLLVGLLAGALVFRIAFRLLGVWLYSYSGLRILFEFRQRLFEHVERLSPFQLKGERRGDILARLTSDVDVLHRAAAQTLASAAQDVLTIAGILIVLFWLDPFLAGVLLLAYPWILLILLRVNRGLREESNRAREAISGLYSFLGERVGMVRLIQELRREKGEARRHVQVSRPWMRTNLRLSVIGAGQVSLADLMGASAFVVVFLLGGLRALEGSLTPGSLVAFYTIAYRLYRPISGLIDVNVNLQMARAALARLYGLLDMEPEVREAADPVDLESVRGEFRLTGVGLTWPDGTRALEGIDLTIPAGGTTALVGPSGSGKSTLVALLARYLDPDRGAVALDGVDLRRLRSATLRRSIAFVSQETQLFHDTLGVNLRMARRDATEDELRAALEAVELGEFFEGLPEGFDTDVGEEGLRLSGGERQRLALARALLKEPAVLLLDEATSALDPPTERRILERLFALGKTVVLVAHRTSSVMGCDRILVLAGGRLVESGTHADLVGAGGVYQSLHAEPEERGHDE